jgi:hypothetical protein
VIARLFSSQRLHRRESIIIVTAIADLPVRAYGIVIYLGATTQDWLSERVWSLGRFSKPIAWLSVFWVIVLMVLFSFPTSGNISWPFMAATVLFLVVYFFASARRNFKGPHRMGDSAELTEIEREFEAAAGEVTT